MAINALGLILTTALCTIPSGHSFLVQPSDFRRYGPLFVAPQQLGSFEELLLVPTEQQELRRVALYDRTPYDPIPFQQAWDWQKRLVNAHFERLSSSDQKNSFMQSGDCAHHEGDTIIFLQHEPVYTLGTASDPDFILNDPVGVDIVRMDRGGEVTYHGPGQLVVYPLLDFRSYRQDIHWYMRALEEVVLRALVKVGIDDASRQDDVTGVWVQNRKVAAIGIKTRRWVSTHGLAVNIEYSSLAHFKGIVPCGLEGRDVGCVNQFLDKPITVQEFATHVKEALEDVFRVYLVPMD